MTNRLLARIRRGDDLLTGELVGGAFHVLSGTVIDPGTPTGEVLPPGAFELVCPVSPSKVVAAALNYRAHAVEMNKPVPTEPMFFIKPATAVIGPGEAVRLPPDSGDVQHEAEMALVVGRTLYRASEEEARAALVGVTGAVDVTARDVQRRQVHYTRAKSYDTFCPLGPVVACGVDPTDLRVQLRVNGETRQDGRTSDMVFGPYKLLSFISHVMTLLPGDVVLTGTPLGVGTLHDGDVMEMELEGAGVLRVSVQAG